MSRPLPDGLGSTYEHGFAGCVGAEEKTTAGLLSGPNDIACGKRL